MFHEFPRLTGTFIILKVVRDRMTEKGIGIKYEYLPRLANGELRPRGDERAQIPRTEKIVINNIGPFEGRTEIAFTPGINLIVGPCGSGRTTVIRCLRAAYEGGVAPITKNIQGEGKAWYQVIPAKCEIQDQNGNRMEGFLDEEKMTGRIKQFMDNLPGYEKLSTGQKVLTDLVYMAMATRETECLLGDEIFSALDTMTLESAFEFLKKQDFQMIFTYPWEDCTDHTQDVNVIAL